MSNLKLTITRKNQEYLDMNFDLWDIILLVDGDKFQIVKNMVIEENPDTLHPLQNINKYAVECHQVFNEHYYINSKLTHDKTSYERIL